jgi:hypothetical protein
MLDSGKAVKLLGSTLREIGVLVIVFAPLEAFLRDQSPPLGWLLVVMVFSLLFIALGIMLEIEENE